MSEIVSLSIPRQFGQFASNVWRAKRKLILVPVKQYCKAQSKIHNMGKFGVQERDWYTGSYEIN